MRAALLENARFRYHTSLEPWKEYDFRLENAAGAFLDLSHNATFMEDASWKPVTNATVPLSNMPAGATRRDRREKMPLSVEENG